MLLVTDPLGSGDLKRGSPQGACPLWILELETVPKRKRKSWQNSGGEEDGARNGRSTAKARFSDFKEAEAGVPETGPLDTAGNVLEWTSSLDWPHPYRADDGRENPDLPGTVRTGVARGATIIGTTGPGRGKSPRTNIGLPRLVGMQPNVGAGASTGCFRHVLFGEGSGTIGQEREI